MNTWVYFDPPNEAGAAFHKERPDPAKDAVGKIAQLVPGPVLGAYGAALGTMPLFTPSLQPWIGMGLFLLGMAGTAWLVAWAMEPNVKRARHIVVYVLAFAVWAYSLTGMVALPWLYHPGVAVLLPIIGSFVFNQIRLPKVTVNK